MMGLGVIEISFVEQHAYHLHNYGMRYGIKVNKYNNMN